MKRVWFAIIFLIITAVLCTAEQLYIERFYTDMSSAVTEAEAAAERNDGKAYKKAAKRMAAIWEDRNNILYTVAEHRELDDIAVHIRAMPYGEGEEIKELHSLRAQLYAYYENEKISLTNIL